MKEEEQGAREEEMEGEEKGSSNKHEIEASRIMRGNAGLEGGGGHLEQKLRRRGRGGEEGWRKRAGYKSWSGPA